jgi:hypothetical protein
MLQLVESRADSQNGDDSPVVGYLRSHRIDRAKLASDYAELVTAPVKWSRFERVHRSRVHRSLEVR